MADADMRRDPQVSEVRKHSSLGHHGVKLPTRYQNTCSLFTRQMEFRIFSITSDSCLDPSFLLSPNSLAMAPVCTRGGNGWCSFADLTKKTTGSSCYCLTMSAAAILLGSKKLRVQVRSLRSHPAWIVKFKFKNFRSTWRYVFNILLMYGLYSSYP